jgi:hypothetical protein
MAGEHFGHAGHGCLDFAGDAVRVPGDLQLDKNRHAKADLGPVDYCPVASDDAVLLEAAQPAQTRRRRKPHALGQLRIGDTAVLLQDGQNPGI